MSKSTRQTDWKSTHGKIHLRRCPMVLGRCLMVKGRCFMVPGRCPMVPGGCPMVLGRCPMVPERCPMVPGTFSWSVSSFFCLLFTIYCIISTVYCPMFTVYFLLSYALWYFPSLLQLQIFLFSPNLSEFRQLHPVQFTVYRGHIYNYIPKFSDFLIQTEWFNPSCQAVICSVLHYRHFQWIAENMALGFLWVSRERIPAWFIDSSTVQYSTAGAN